MTVGRHRLARKPRRWSMTAAALLVPAAASLCTAAGGSHSARNAEKPSCCTELLAVTAVNPARAGVISELRTTDRAASRAVRRVLATGVAPENGLQVKTIWAARAVSAMFPEIRDIGGVRPDAMRWHPNGLAIDVMIPDWNSPAGRQLGDQIVAFALANAERFDIEHVIWRQVYYPRTGAPHVMSNMGSDNANHYTHVHIATKGGGYPTGGETYFG